MATLAPRRAAVSYAGFAPSDQPYEVGGQPWAMPAVTPPKPPGQMGQYQGLGNWGSDPFGYTNGSMLQPWTQPLPAWTPGGGVATPQFNPWQFDAFQYNYRDPGSFVSREIAAPADFTYRDFDAPTPFRGPSQAEIESDPVYQARMKSGTNAIERSAAAAGTLRGGGTLRGLMEYGQRIGAEEGDKVYGRRASEYDRAYGISRDVYTTNRGNAAENFDRNTGNRLDVAKTNEANRRAGFDSDAAAAASMGRLGLDAYTAGYDRNRENAMVNWEAQAEMERAAAAAANAGNERDYQRAMSEYMLAMDIYNNNQDRQFNRLSQMTNLGYGAASQQSGYADARGGRLSDLYTGGANARAAGTVGSANAWNAGISGIANTAMDLYGMYQLGRPGGGIPGRTWRPTIPGGRG